MKEVIFFERIDRRTGKPYFKKIERVTKPGRNLDQRVFCFDCKYYVAEYEFNIKDPNAEETEFIFDAYLEYVLVYRMPVEEKPAVEPQPESSQTEKPAQSSQTEESSRPEQPRAKDFNQLCQLTDIHGQTLQEIAKQEVAKLPKFESVREEARAYYATHQNELPLQVESHHLEMIWTKAQGDRSYVHIRFTCKDCGQIWDHNYDYEIDPYVRGRRLSLYRIATNSYSLKTVKIYKSDDMRCRACHSADFVTCQEIDDEQPEESSQTPEQPVDRYKSASQFSERMHDAFMRDKGYIKSLDNGSLERRLAIIQEKVERNIRKDIYGENAIPRGYDPAAYGLLWTIKRGTVNGETYNALKRLSTLELCQLIHTLLVEVGENIGDYAAYLMKRFSNVTH